MDKLTNKQEKFCQEYILDLNATQAAIRAKYSPQTARSIGPELLKKLVIQDRIKELQKETAERNRLTADEIIGKLRCIADMWRTQPGAATRALELLGRHLGIFNADANLNQQITIVTTNYAGAVSSYKPE